MTQDNTFGYLWLLSYNELYALQYTEEGTLVPVDIHDLVDTHMMYTKIMKDREVTSTRCPICHKPAKRKIRWFMNNSKVYYSISLCQEHGFVMGKIRLRKTENNMYYAIKTLTNVSDEEAEEIRQKREAHRAKKRSRKAEETAKQ